jgi:hypothetical protein
MNLIGIYKTNFFEKFYLPQHFLYFLPLPQAQKSFRFWVCCTADVESMIPLK